MDTFIIQKHNTFLKKNLQEIYHNNFILIDSTKQIKHWYLDAIQGKKSEKDLRMMISQFHSSTFGQLHTSAGDNSLQGLMAVLEYIQTCKRQIHILSVHTISILKETISKSFQVLSLSHLGFLKQKRTQIKVYAKKLKCLKTKQIYKIVFV